MAGKSSNLNHYKRRCSVTVFYPNGNIKGTYTTIQAGVNACPTGGTVSCADGIYTGIGNKDLTWTGKHITVRSVNGAADTIIDCEYSGRGFNFNNTGQNSSDLIDGFTIRNGNADYGGGIYCYYSSPSILNCTISGNTVTNYGGGICCWNSSPSILNCVISGNTANQYGGGICCESSSSPSILNCTISGNNATNYGGGGILCDWYSSPLIFNCTISGNTAGHDGGGIGCYNFSSPSILNCIISGNNATNYGGGIGCYDSSSPSINYNCVWGNSSGNYSGCSAGPNDISANPQFIAGADFHLGSSSPCIDAGSNTAPGIYGTSTDKDGKPRIVNGVVDMGVYEYQGPFVGSVTVYNASGGFVGTYTTIQKG